MAKPDVVALTRSTLNPFLFAGIGTQMNGADLTILSLLARLGSDPWVEAGQLAAMPRTTAAAWLAERIATMPLSAQAIGEAGGTAARLVLLLPSQLTLRASAAPGTEKSRRADNALGTGRAARERPRPGARSERHACPRVPGIGCRGRPHTSA